MVSGERKTAGKKGGKDRRDDRQLPVHALFRHHVLRNVLACGPIRRATVEVIDRFRHPGFSAGGSAARERLASCMVREGGSRRPTLCLSPNRGSIFLSGKSPSVYNRSTIKPYNLTCRIGGPHGRLRPDHDPVRFQPPSPMGVEEQAL